jgi:large subunit ribosomal protein L10
MLRPEKEKEVEGLKEKFANAKGIVLADFTGLTVDEANKLRSKCREAEVEYKVVKNTLARLATRRADIADLETYFEGPVAVALSDADSTAPPRVIADFRQEFPKLVFKAGYLEGRVYPAEDLREIAMLPPREGILAQVIGAMQAPMGQIIWSVEGILRNVISILDQASKKGDSSS